MNLNASFTQGDAFKRQASSIVGGNNESGTAKSSVKAESVLHSEAEKCINFKKMLQQYRDRSEFNVGYTIMQVEDVMMVDDSTIVALEYVFYNKEGQYHKIKRSDQAKAGKKDRQSHMLGDQTYMRDLNKEKQQLSAFRQEPQIFYEDEKDYLKKHTKLEREGIMKAAKQKHKRGSFSKAGFGFSGLTDTLQAGIKNMEDQKTLKFMETVNGKDAIVEGIISLWKVNFQGQLKQKRQQSFEYNQKFQRTCDGKMQLRLSLDQKFIVLGLVNELQQVSILAWDSKKLKPYRFTKELTESIKRASLAKKFETITLCGDNKYLILVEMRKDKDSREGKGKVMYYMFFRTDNGQKVFEFSNYDAKKIGFKFSPDQDQNLKCLGLLVKEKERDFNEEVDNFGEEDGDDDGDDDDDKDIEPEDSEEEDSDDEKINEVNENVDENIGSSEEEDTQIKVEQDWSGLYEIHVGDGTNPDMEIMSCTSDGQVQLESKVQSNCQLWTLTRLKNGNYHIQVNDETNPDAWLSLVDGITNSVCLSNQEYFDRTQWELFKSQDEDTLSIRLAKAKGNKKFLGCSENGQVSLFSKDTWSGRQRWRLIASEGLEQEETAEFEGGQPDQFEDVMTYVSNNPLNLVFFFAQQVAEVNPQNWVMTFVNIPLLDLLNQESKHLSVDHINYVFNQALQKYDEFQKQAQDFFEIPKNWFIKDDQKNKDNKKGLQWQNHIQITSNMYFSHFGLINTKEKTYLAFDNTEQETGDGKTNFSNLEMAKFIIPDNSIASHGRNQLTKKFLYLIVRVQGEGTAAHCFFEKDSKQTIRFNTDHIYAMQDARVIRIPNVPKDAKLEDKFLLQSTSISEGDQEIMLKTMQQQDAEVSKELRNIFRKSITQKHQGHFPMFMYNLGMKKLLIQCTLGSCKSYIYELPKDESFMDFVDYNKFEDIGFYPMNLRIEMCSNFVFLTYNQKLKRTFMNVILVDPYYYDVQFALFQSTKFFDDKESKKQNDVMVKNIIYCTKKKAKDTDFKVKLLTQYFDVITDPIELKEDAPNENSEDESDGKGSAGNSQSSSDTEDEDEDQEEVAVKYEAVPMILNKKGDIFYVVSQDGTCIIKQIQPKHDVEHREVLSLKSSKCLGFQSHKKHYFFIDEKKSIYRLKQDKETKMLQESGHLYIKNQDRPNLHIFSFADLIIRDEYLINESKIFYLHDKKAWMNGILDMEDLAEDNKKNKELLKEYANGPFKMIGSEQFVVVYKYGDPNDSNYRQRTYQLPDSSNISLINDQQEKTNFSTYLDDGKIFLNVGHRYVLFDKDGIFMDIVEFQFNEEQSKDAFSANLQQLAAMKRNSHQLKQMPTLKALNAQSPEQNKEVKKMEKIEAHNRMKLFGMSNDNQLYLFQDNLTFTYWVYKLVNSSKKVGGAMDKFSEKKIGFLKKDDANQSSSTRQIYTDRYDFVPQYEVKIFESHILTDKFNMAKGYEDADQKLSKFLEDGQIQTQITDEGRVTIITSSHEEESTHIEVWGSIFTRDGDVSNFKQAVDFDPEAKSNINFRISKQESKLKNLLAIEEQIQDRLPKNFRDNDKKDDLNQQLESLTQRRQKIVQTKTQSDLLIIQCGKYIKYAKMDKSMFNDDIDSENQFKELALEFDQGVEICQLYTTSIPSHLQIVAKDNQKQILYIVTWDTDKNIEVSSLQRRTQQSLKPENYVLKGVNRKMNYFIDHQSIFDLEFNIPIQESTFISDFKRGINKFRQQRKIFENTSRYLGVDHPNMMYFPTTRLDILFWKSIVDLGEDPKHIQENTTLAQFMHVYNDNSLFHYFSQNVEVMEMINKKFKDALDDDLLTDADRNMPLYLLAPDKEQNTALEIALKRQRPRCFECMVEMLQKYDSFFLTKMMLNSLPEMISNNSDTIINFFSENIYISPSMEAAQLIPWPKDMDELIFASHTSIITGQIIVDQIGRFMDLKQHQEKMELQKRNDKFEQIKLATRPKSQLRTWDLNPEIDEESTMKRVRIEAIDFDWIFTGDNVENMINLLADNANSKLFIQKSIRVFINLIWETYQPLIVWRIFIPYMMYLACFIHMSSHWSIVMLDEIDNFEENPELVHSHRKHRIILFILSICTSVGLVYNLKSEAQSLRRNGFYNYITDIWNILDIVSSFLNILFMFFLNLNVYKETNHFSHFSKYQIRTFGACGTFFMWIKVFYWMRLFDFTAHYVKLILRIISDVKVFLTMLTIIVLAYSNFFYIINFNSSANEENKEFQGEDDEFRYVSEKVGLPVVDAILGMYLIALGEFASMDSYTSGPNQLSAWIMFTTSTGILLIVFMNMLIVIVSQTFETVEEQRDQLAIGEQLALIQDYIFLIDLKQKFANSKYIIRFYPDFTVKETDDIDKEEFEDLQNSIAIKHDQVLDYLKKIETSEKNTKNMLKQQQIRMNTIQHSIEVLSKKVSTQNEDQ